MTYMKRCWEVYHIYGRLYAGSTDDKMMTYRHLLWLYRVFYRCIDRAYVSASDKAAAFSRKTVSAV